MNTPTYKPNAVAGAPVMTAPPAATMPSRLSAENFVSGIWNVRNASVTSITAMTAMG